jgi:hypothetical protein
MAAIRSTALSKAGDLVCTVTDSGAAQNSQDLWMCGAAFI